MTMMARRLGPVQHALARQSQFGECGGMRALLLPDSRAGASISSPVSTATRRAACSRSTTSRSHYSTAAVGARGVTAATTTMHPREGSAPLPGRTSGGIRHSMGSGGFNNNRAAAGRLNPARATAAVLLYGGEPRTGGVVCSPRTIRQWQSGGGGVVFLQAASLRTTAVVSGPAAAAAGDGKTPPETPPKAAGGAGSSSPSGTSSGSSGSTANGSTTPPQATSPAAVLAAAAEKRSTPPDVKSAASIGDERTTVRGGNPTCRGGDGSFIQMRNRMRHARFDASEDAKDWMRDKRDDMNTMKEVRVTVVRVHSSLSSKGEW